MSAPSDHARLAPLLLGKPDNTPLPLSRKRTAPLQNADARSPGPHCSASGQAPGADRPAVVRSRDQVRILVPQLVDRPLLTHEGSPYETGIPKGQKAP